MYIYWVEDYGVSRLYNADCSECTMDVNNAIRNVLLIASVWDVKGRNKKGKKKRQSYGINSIGDI